MLSVKKKFWYAFAFTKKKNQGSLLRNYELISVVHNFLNLQ